MSAESQGAGAVRRRPSKSIVGRGALYIAMTIIALPFVFPLYWMLATALKRLGQVFENPPRLWPLDPQWANFAEPFVNGPFLRQYGNSLYMAAAVTLIVLTFSSLAGYAFARIHFPARNVIFLVLLTALLVPGEVTILPLFKLLDAVGLVDNPLSVILSDAFGGSMILGVFLMRQFFLGIPEELEQAGRVDGLGRFGLFWRIALPLARAPLAALGILTFLGSWNELLSPLVFLRTRELQTIPQALMSLVDVNSGEPIWNIQMAATFLSILPVLLAFFVAQKQFVQGIAGTGIK